MNDCLEFKLIEHIEIKDRIKRLKYLFHKYFESMEYRDE